MAFNRRTSLPLPRSIFFSFLFAFPHYWTKKIEHPMKVPIPANNGRCYMGSSGDFILFHRLRVELPKPNALSSYVLESSAS